MSTIFSTYFNNTELFDYSSGNHNENTVIKEIKELTMRYPEKWLIFIRLYKKKIPDAWVKPKNSVYELKQIKVEGFLYQNGEEIDRAILWQEN